MVCRWVGQRGAAGPGWTLPLVPLSWPGSPAPLLGRGWGGGGWTCWGTAVSSGGRAGACFGAGRCHQKQLVARCASTVVAQAGRRVGRRRRHRPQRHARVWPPSYCQAGSGHPAWLQGDERDLTWRLPVLHPALRKPVHRGESGCRFVCNSRGVVVGRCLECVECRHGGMPAGRLRRAHARAGEARAHACSRPLWRWAKPFTRSPGTLNCMPRPF